MFIRHFWLLSALVIGFLGVASASNSFATIIAVDTQDERIPMGYSLELYEDKTARLTLNDIQQLVTQGEFESSDSLAPSYGFTNSAIWVKFNLQNNDSDDLKRKLQIEFPLLEKVTLYSPINGEYVAYVQGTAPDTDRMQEHRTLVFDLTLAAQSVQTYYLKVEGEETIQLPLILWEPKALAWFEKIELYTLGMYFGIVVVMCLYNLFLWLFIRHVSYLYYVLYTFFFGAFVYSQNGLLIQHFFVEAPYLVKWMNPALCFATLVCAVLFTQSFLQTQKNDPVIHRLLNGVLLLSCTIFIGFFLDDLRYSASAAGISAGLVLITIIVAVALSLKRGFKPALYFAIAFMAVIAGAILYALKSFGLLPANWLTVYALQIGSAMEVVLLSLGLASRINMLKAEKAEAEKLAYEVQISTNKLKDEFISTITHELLTPINGIKLSLDLARKMDAPEKLESLVRTAQDSTAHLHRLVDSMLTFVEAKRGSMKLLLADEDLRKSLESEFNQFREFKQPNVKMEFEWDSALPNRVMLDAKKLQVLVTQVLKNAVAHTTAGSIVMKVYPSDDNKFTVEITDTGTGIEPAKLKTVFEAFHQLDGSMTRDYGGLGLGLAIVKDLLQLMNGTFSIDSELGKGTRIAFTLPMMLASGEVKPTHQPQPINRVEFPPDITVMVVEDNPVNLMLLCRILEHENIDVERAANGVEAVEKAKNSSAIGAILMDCQMPVMDGYTATREIRKLPEYRDIPIIAVTANISEIDKGRCIECGMDDVLNKPTSKDVVLKSLSDWLSKK